MLPSVILRAYDIRGVFDDSLTPEYAHAIGYHFAKMVEDGKASRICVGRDGRVSSPALHKELIRGLQDAGAHVVDIGVGPTPMLYTATKLLDADAGVMITGSHNPKNHNGFKILTRHGPFHGKAIQDLAKRVDDQPITPQPHQEVIQRDITQEYVALLTKSLPKAPIPMTIAWDAGNGAAGEIVEALSQHVQATHHTLYTKIDGDFPNHHPDPSVKENVNALIEAVIKHKADIGFAFDGDGDRLAVVDEQGHILTPEQLLFVLGSYLLKHHPGGTIIVDVKTSNQLIHALEAQGGKVVMWKTGHSLIKEKMKEIGAIFAGEASGHIFFADHYNFDDALYAATLLLNIVAESGQPLSALAAGYTPAPTTGEMRIEVKEDEKFTLVEAIKKHAQEDKEGTPLLIDGIRMNYEHGWYLVRASNTQAVLVAQAEGEDEEALAFVRSKLDELLVS